MQPAGVGGCLPGAKLFTENGVVSILSLLQKSLSQAEMLLYPRASFSRLRLPDHLRNLNIQINKRREESSIFVIWKEKVFLSPCKVKLIQSSTMSVSRSKPTLRGVHGCPLVKCLCCSFLATAGTGHHVKQLEVCPFKP